MTFQITQVQQRKYNISEVDYNKTLSSRANNLLEGNTLSEAVISCRCPFFNGEEGGVEWDTPLSNNLTEWAVAFKAIEFRTGGRDSVIGGGFGAQLEFPSVNTKLGFRDSGGAYFHWDGSGNTSDADFDDLRKSVSQNFMYRSDGTNIYLYIDGVSYGYITPDSTQLYFKNFTNGYPNIHTLRGYFWDLAFWNTDIGETELLKYHTWTITTPPTNYFYDPSTLLDLMGNNNAESFAGTVSWNSAAYHALDRAFQLFNTSSDGSGTDFYIPVQPDGSLVYNISIGASQSILGTTYYYISYHAGGGFHNKYDSLIDFNPRKLNYDQYDLELFNRYGGVKGSDLITNGNFADSSDWVENDPGGNLTIADGYVSTDGGQGADISITQSDVFISGQKYLVRFILPENDGTVKIATETGDLESIATDGLIRRIITADGNDLVLKFASGTTAILDTVSAVSITPYYQDLIRSSSYNDQRFAHMLHVSELEESNLNAAYQSNMTVREVDNIISGIDLVVNTYDSGTLSLFIGDDDTVVFGLWGQSNALGQARTISQEGPNIGDGFYYSGGLLYHLMDADFSGSSGPPFGKYFHSRTGKKVLIAKKGRGSTGMTPKASADPYNWSETGDLYADAKQITDGALSYVNADVPFGIIWIQGEQDAGVRHGDSSYTISDIRIAYINFIERIKADYPGTALYMVLLSNSGYALDAWDDVRNIHREMAELYDNVQNVVYETDEFFGEYFNDDNLHYNTSGQNLVGRLLAEKLRL